VNRKTLVSHQITKLSKENVFFGAYLRDLALDPNIAKPCYPVLQRAGEIGYAPWSELTGNSRFRGLLQLIL
jgi:hypothetical protein